MATAIITGASQGIGACIAKRLAKDGFDIALNHYPSDGDKEKALAVAEECRALGVKVECYAADVSKFDQCEAMVKQVKADFGTIDALVNNAGITKDKLLARMSEEDYDVVIAVNQKSVYNMTKHVCDEAETRTYRQCFFCCRSLRKSGTDELFRYQSRYHRHDENNSQGVRLTQYHLQCRCSRSYPYTNDRCAFGRAEG